MLQQYGSLSTPHGALVVRFACVAGAVLCQCQNGLLFDTCREFDMCQFDTCRKGQLRHVLKGAIRRLLKSGWTRIEENGTTCVE